MARQTFTIDAFIFDMDGVLTDTAEAHFHAWKAVFDAHLQAVAGDAPKFSLDDYRNHVDGKPRSDGIADFLKARGFEASNESITTLAEKKNGAFHDWLKQNRVQTYPGTIQLIEALRANGIPYALFTASKNAEIVLANAGIRDLIPVLIDGNVAASGGLAGKPAPDVLLEAALRLHVEPGKTGVLEDAYAGIEAAHRGGFFPKIALAHGAGEQTFLDHGADLVVDDAATLRILGPHTLEFRDGNDP